MELVVGIDLGTTNSEIAVIKDGAPHVIPVDGEIIMPSCVGIDGSGAPVVGRPAKNQMVSDPESTILSIKRKMGQDIKIRLGERELTPEEISSLILRKLKDEAEAYLGREVKRAVITVPAYFDDSQRKATKNAGTLAGLEVMRIINEPTAAALAYDGGLEGNQTLLVYDLGGGTFDVSLVSVENGVVEVKASHGDTHLGGDDFDDLLIKHVAQIFKEQHDLDLLADSRSRNRLWSAVEKAKRELSDAPYASIKEEFIHGDHHLDIEISRMDYENMIHPLLKKTLSSVHQCLKDGGLLPGSIDKIILVGGATRTPLVAETIRSEMGTEPRHEINPDIIVAMGAAIQAGIVSGVETSSVLVDITPYTFGTGAVAPYAGEIREDVFVPIIRRNTPLPVSKGEVFSTMFDGQEAVDVRIYQGEEPIATDNIFIGNFMVEGLSDVPAGNEIVLDLHLDLNGILEVTAVEKRTGLSKTVKMGTGAKKGVFDLEKAQQNIQALVGENGSESLPGMPTSAKKETLLRDARDLRKRAEELMGSVEETDASELQALVSESRESISNGDFERLAELNESLSDMLFYLED
ncbi:MAG: heat-shock protein Hsp70 [Desulfobacteraceae bacterium 4484_190.3]|nr:MAG: heat-shock protein Hsp70 [Desulfobacteraceae bacterium 4484_190.3]